MPSSPNVMTTSGCSSRRIAATRSTSASNGSVLQPVVGVPQPLVAVRGPAQRDPRPAILVFPDRAEGLARGERRIGDHAGLAARGVDEDEPEARIVRVQRDGARARRTCRRRDGRRPRRAATSLLSSSRASNPTVRPGREATAFTAITTPGMNERPVDGVVTDRERLPLPTEDDLLVRHRSREPHRVDADALDVAAARAGDALRSPARARHPLRARPPSVARSPSPFPRARPACRDGDAR